MQRNKDISGNQWTVENDGHYAVITKVKDSRDPRAKFEYELEYTDSNGNTSLSYHRLRRDAVSRQVELFNQKVEVKTNWDELEANCQSYENFMTQLHAHIESNPQDSFLLNH